MGTDSQIAIAVVILAAGKGTRMKSDMPKVMHKLAGLSMLQWLIKYCEELQPQKIIVVAAPDAKEVAAAAVPHSVVFQEQQKGTGDAVKPALPLLKDFKGKVLILLGDEPFIDVDVLRQMAAYEGVAVMAVQPDDPTGLGRMITNAQGLLEAIVEDKDCTEEKKQIRLGNAGNYSVPSDRLADWIGRIQNYNAQNEYYLTDLPAIAKKEGVNTKVFEVKTDFGWGVNTRSQLACHEKHAQKLLRQAAMDQGVTLIDPESVTLSWDTKIGSDTIIEPQVFIGPHTVIGNNVILHGFSHIEGAVIEEGAKIGPFARIRPKSIIGQEADVGNFTEINRSVIKPKAKCKHVSYLGDAVIGEESNIGAGTIIANYDGHNKHQAMIGKNVFVGSNSTIISPVTIGDGAIVAAGSNINKNVSENALAIARSRQENHLDWAEQYRAMKLQRTEEE